MRHDYKFPRTMSEAYGTYHRESLTDGFKRDWQSSDALTWGALAGIIIFAVIIAAMVLEAI